MTSWPAPRWGSPWPLALDRLVPTETYDPVRTLDPQLRPQPPNPTGRGVVAVVNPAAGGGRGAGLLEWLRRELPDAAVLTSAIGADLVTELRTAAAGARVLAVGGGDGTVSAGAAAAIEAGIPLLVLPAGTFNHFAADLGLRGVADAVAALRAGTAVTVDVGTAAGAVFVNTASLGAYPAFVAARQRREGWLGKPLAAAWAVVSVLRTERPYRMVVDGRERTVAMMFIGNCRYQPRGFAPNWRPRLDDGRLDVRLLEANHRFGAVRFVAALLTGRLGRSRLYVEDAPGAFTVVDLAGPCAISRDGETGPAPPEVAFGKLVRALTVYHRPAAAARWRLAASPRTPRPARPGVPAGE